jgi:hypothetical protein
MYSQYNANQMIHKCKNENLLFWNDSPSFVRLSHDVVKTWFQKSYYSIERIIQIESIEDVVNFKLHLRKCSVKELNLLQSFHLKRWNTKEFPYPVRWEHQTSEYEAILATLMFPIELECQWEQTNFLYVKPTIQI